MKRIIFSVLMAMGLFLAGAQSARAIMIDFTPLIGGAVDIVISDRGSEIVSAYDLDVAYDPLGLDPIGVTFGNLLGGPFGSLQDVDLSITGIVDLAELSLLSDAALAGLQPDDFVLATIDFDVLDQGGSTDLEFLWAAGNDVKGLRNGVIIPGSVPEPGSVALLAVGLAALGLRRRRSTEKQSAM